MTLQWKVKKYEFYHDNPGTENSRHSDINHLHCYVSENTSFLTIITDDLNIEITTKGYTMIVSSTQDFDTTEMEYRGTNEIISYQKRKLYLLWLFFRKILNHENFYNIHITLYLYIWYTVYFIANYLCTILWSQIMLISFLDFSTSDENFIEELELDSTTIDTDLPMYVKEIAETEETVKGKFI